MIRRLRIFLSSPGDVIATREIAALTIERLAQDYARFFKIEPYLWEYEAMVARLVRRGNRNREPCAG